MKAIIFRNGDEKKPSTYNLYDCYLQDGWTDEDIARKANEFNKGGDKTLVEIVELDETAECIAECYGNFVSFALESLQQLKQKIEKLEWALKTTSARRVVKE